MTDIISPVIISPVLGRIPEETYNYFISRKQLVKSKEQMEVFLKEVRETTNFGVLRTGVLLIESSDKRIDIRGSELESYLNSIGFPRATDLMKAVALNQTLIEDLVSQGWSIRDSVYNIKLSDRLKILGLASRKLTANYSRELLITIYPIIEIPEEIPEEILPQPPETEIWHPFQISMLINCETKGKDGKFTTRSVEFRGTFIAKRDSILDWKEYEKRTKNEEKLLKEAGKTAEEVVSEYAKHKGYDFLFECIEPTFNGFNPMEDADDKIVLLEESNNHETITNLEVVDIDYNRIPFTDKVKYIGHWWKNKNYAITEMRKQVTNESRW